MQRLNTVMMCIIDQKPCEEIEGHVEECVEPVKTCRYKIPFMDFWIHCEHYNHVKGSCEHENSQFNYCSDEECPLIKTQGKSTEEEDDL